MEKVYFLSYQLRNNYYSSNIYNLKKSFKIYPKDYFLHLKNNMKKKKPVINIKTNKRYKVLLKNLILIKIIIIIMDIIVIQNKLEKLINVENDFIQFLYCLMSILY